MNSLIEDLKKKKPVIGLETTIKKMRSGKVSKVYIASSCHAKDQVTKLAKLMNVEVVMLTENNKEVAVLCKKPYAISVLGFE